MGGVSWQGAYDPWATQLQALQCPSDPAVSNWGLGATNYGANALGDSPSYGQTVLTYRAGVSVVVDPTVTVAGSAAPAVTAAQRAVLVALVRPMLASGAAAPAANATIASELVVSLETVRSHMKDLYDRFGLDGVAPSSKRAELAASAVRLAVVSRADL